MGIWDRFTSPFKKAAQFISHPSKITHYITTKGSQFKKKIVSTVHNLPQSVEHAVIAPVQTFFSKEASAADRFARQKLSEAERSADHVKTLVQNEYRRDSTFVETTFDKGVAEVDDIAHSTGEALKKDWNWSKRFVELNSKRMIDRAKKRAGKIKHFFTETLPSIPGDIAHEFGSFWDKIKNYAEYALVAVGGIFGVVVIGGVTYLLFRLKINYNQAFKKK